MEIKIYEENGEYFIPYADETKMKKFKIKEEAEEFLKEVMEHLTRE